MKQATFLFVLLQLVCFQQAMSQKEEKLSAKEIAQIKSDIINRAERNAQDLLNLDHKAVMTFYADVEDFIVFSDGYYWGDYKTVDGIWKDFTGGVRKVLKWDLFIRKYMCSLKLLLPVLLNFTMSESMDVEIKRRGMAVFHLA